MPIQIMYNTFISYNSSDRPIVAVIAAALRDVAGIELFFDEWSIVPGDDWQEELEKSLWDSASCAIFIGANGFGPWHKREMRSALERRAGDPAFRVIPIILPSFSAAMTPTIPPFLRQYSWVDFRKGLNDQVEFERLVRGILGQRPSASLIADQIRHRLEDANSEALSMVQEHSKIDSIASYGNTLTLSAGSALSICMLCVILGWYPKFLVLYMAFAFFVSMPFWYYFLNQKFQTARIRYAQRFNNLYGEWRFKVNPDLIFKLDMRYCPGCNAQSICSRLNGKFAYIAQTILWKSAVGVSLFGGFIFFASERKGSGGWGVQALLLFTGTLLIARELWGWRRFKFLCLIKGHEFSSFDGIIPSLMTKLGRLFTRG